MKLQPKALSSRKFWLFITSYVIISFSAFLLTTGGYTSLYFLIYLGPFYLCIWLLLSLVCIISSRVRYSPILIYFVLLIQSISIIFNISDGGYFGTTCKTKNLIQNLFDPNSCGELWMRHEVYIQVLILYALVVTVFVLDVLRLRFFHSENC